MIAGDSVIFRVVYRKEKWMKYISTRGSSERIDSSEAIINGIAGDRGLYVPESIPNLPVGLEELKGMSYKEIAKMVLGAFFTDFSKEQIEYCVNSAYDDKFSKDDVVGFTKTKEVHFLELYHGKTAAFKDMALSILPFLLTESIKMQGSDKKICILTATSGDTGKAALEGFANVEGVDIIVFYPNNGVSTVQERQMITQQGDNTHVFAIEGNFDDAQTAVKDIFTDSEFAKEIGALGYKFSSANSINIGRLVPQVAYYVYSYAKLLSSGQIKAGDPINVVVPTGNFGNILAGYYAKHMGLPIAKLICASNENKVLTDFFETGVYHLDREFYLTSSPSMDILVSSNLERLLFNLSGNDGAQIKNLMKSLDENKRYEVSPEIKKGLLEFYAGFSNSEKGAQNIKELYDTEHYLMDTHTAVAYSVYKDYKKNTGDDTDTVIVSTASAYKFAESVAAAIGSLRGKDGFEDLKNLSKHTSTEIPCCLRDLDKRDVIHGDVIKVGEMRKAILNCLK